MSKTKNAAGRVVPCPTCGGDSLYSPDNPYRPFCSERCQNIDFGAWASESYRVEAKPDASDSQDDPHGPQ